MTQFVRRKTMQDTSKIKPGQVDAINSKSVLSKSLKNIVWIWAVFICVRQIVRCGQQF